MNLPPLTRIYTNTAVSAGAGDTVVGLRAPEGHLWEVLWAAAYQNDGAVAQSWSFVDLVATYPGTTVWSDTAGGANERWVLGQEQGGQPATAGAVFNCPITVTEDRYLLYHFTASAAAKTGYIIALVREYKGFATEQ